VNCLKVLYKGVEKWDSMVLSIPYHLNVSIKESLFHQLVELRVNVIDILDFEIIQSSEKYFRILTTFSIED
jgi:hypothetical protein